MLYDSFLAVIVLFCTFLGGWIIHNRLKMKSILQDYHQTKQKEKKKSF